MYLTRNDLAPFATIEESLAEAMIADAEAQALLAAPCLIDATKLSAEQTAGIKAVLRRAVLRWHEAGTGGVTQESAGPFARTVDTTSTASKSLFWPSEIRALRDICRQVSGQRQGGAFTIDMTGSADASVHRPWCSLAFGATYCSCGADLNGGEGPIFEAG